MSFVNATKEAAASAVGRHPAEAIFGLSIPHPLSPYMPRRLLLLLLPTLRLARPATAQTNPVSTRPALTHVIVYLNGTALK